MASKTFTTLGDVFRMLNPADLAGSLSFSGPDKPDIKIAKKIKDITINSDVSVYDSPSLKLELDNFIKGGKNSDALTAEQRKQFFELVRFYSSAGRLSGNDDELQRTHTATNKSGDDEQTNVTIDDIVGPAGRNDKPVSIILSNSPYIHPATRNVETVEQFLNSIPTIVMSRCVPYLDVEFEFERPWNSVDTSGIKRLKAAGLLKFLLGTGEEQLKTGPNAAMYDAHTRTRNGLEMTYAGSELFTSPQTLVNPLPISKNGRYVDVLDPFRPMMTLQSVEISVAPTVGMYSYKKAKMVLKLHDRSRLAEVSDLVKPEVYSRTTIWMTYGWNHPDEHSNPYSDFINQMKTRESYGIVNSAYVFEQTGGVTITLELFTKAMSEMLTLKLHESEKSSATFFKNLERLYADWADYRQNKGLDNPDGVSKEIRPVQILDGALRGDLFSSNRGDLREAARQMTKAIQSGKVKDDASKKLAEELKKLPDDYDRAIKSVRDEVDAKFKEARSGLDPFLPSIKDEKGGRTPRPWAELVRSMNGVDAKVKSADKKVVSFAKLFSSFVIPALTTINGIDDVQVFFYAFNDGAAAAAGSNIGEFPVEMRVFLAEWRDHVMRRGGTENLTVEEFLRVLVDSQINNDRAIPYGLRKFYSFNDSGELQIKKDQDKAKESEEIKLIDRYGVFKKPVIEMYVESLAADNGQSLSSSSGKVLDLTRSVANPAAQGEKPTGVKRVLRIHIYDKQLHPYRTVQQLMRSDEGESKYYSFDPEKVKDTPALKALDKSADSHQRAADAIKALVTSGPALDITSNAVIKDQVSRLVPTIVYGSNTTGVINATLSSQQVPLLSTVQMMRAGRQNVIHPNGEGVGGVPLRIIPASLSMTTMGCPFLNLAQIYFVDFNTGTTADNLYILTHLTHTFAPGKYESQATLTFLDGYGRYQGAQTLTKAIDQFINGQKEPDESRTKPSKGKPGK